MSDERMTFEAACRELGVSEAELEALVAAGEISSIKEGDTLFFKPDVVSLYKDSKDGDGTILLADEEIPLLEDEDGIEEIDLLSLDEDETAATTPIADPSAAAEEISLEGDGIISLEDDLPEIDLDLDDALDPAADLQASSDADETLLNIDGLLEEEAESTTPVAGGDDLLGEDTLLDTELDFGDETDTFEIDTVDDLAGDVTEDATLLRGGGARVMSMKKKSSHAVETVVLAVSAMLLLVPLSVVLSMSYVSNEKRALPDKDSHGWVKDYNVLGGAAEWVADALKAK